MFIILDLDSCPLNPPFSSPSYQPTQPITSSNLLSQFYSFLIFTVVTCQPQPSCTLQKAVYGSRTKAYSLEHHMASPDKTESCFPDSVPLFCVSPCQITMPFLFIKTNSIYATQSGPAKTSITSEQILSFHFFPYIYYTHEMSSFIFSPPS